MNRKELAVVASAHPSVASAHPATSSEVAAALILLIYNEMLNMLKGKEVKREEVKTKK